MARRRKPDPYIAFRDELNRSLAEIAGRPAPAMHQDIATRLGLNPIIFANDEDDDPPGLIAAIENRWVLFDDRLYQPGEPLIIERRRLRSSRRIFVLGPGHDGAGLAPEWVRVVQPADGRRILISHSDIRLCDEVLP